MQAQAQVRKAETKGELLYEVHSKNVTTTIKELSPLGVRLQSNSAGEAQGKYNAAVIATVNILQKPDGTLDYELKAVHSTKDGDSWVTAGKGVGRVTGPGKSEGEGELTFMTMSPRLSALNDTKGWLEATVEADGTITGRVYSKK